MSIVKMKRLRVIGFSEERDELLQGLLHMGCVEISEPDDKMADQSGPPCCGGTPPAWPTERQSWPE